MYEFTKLNLFVFTELAGRHGSATPQQLLCTLAKALCQRGLGLVHVPTQVQALQAKDLSRLLEPEQLT